MTEVTVRRRGGLMALVAVCATVVSAGYLWHFSETGSGAAFLVGVASGVVALGHVLAWSGSRAPMFVADGTGVRVRLGSGWSGLPWEAVQRVEVGRRGRVRDGHVCVVPVDEQTALAGASRRSRWAAALNLRMYDSSLVVPYGLTTSVSVTDVAAGLAHLAAGRAEVDVLGHADDSRNATVDLASSGPVQPGGLDNPDPLPELAPRTASSEGDSDVGMGTRPRRRLWVARQAAPAAASRPLVSSLASRPATRAEVTMPARTHHATLGGLALSQLDDDRATAFPEMRELRRSIKPELSVDRGDLDRTNVSLIIDATTDLSARAMQKVRRSEAPPQRSEPPLQHGDSATDTTIGREISQARRTLGLSVDELGERTRIRPYVIESIEVDDFSPCGGDFYARGHLRMLARVLGVEAAPLLADYEEHVAAAPVNARDVFEVELATGTTGLIRGGESGANWGALIAAVLVLVLIWGVALFFIDDKEATRAGVTPTSNAHGPRSPSPGEGDPIPAPPVTAHVKISAIGGDSHVVVTDRLNHVVFDSLLPRGVSKKLTGQAPLTVAAADGGVVQLHIRGHSLGVMGPAGQRARDRVGAQFPRA